MFVFDLHNLWHMQVVITQPVHGHKSVFAYDGVSAPWANSDHADVYAMFAPQLLAVSCAL